MPAVVSGAEPIHPTPTSKQEYEQLGKIEYLNSDS